MQYPSLREYKAAISNTKNINIPFFTAKSIQIFLNKQGMPYMSVGGFGAVFQIKDKNENHYALKVFTRDAPGRAERYKALNDTLQITKFPFMVDFHYVGEGLKVGKEYYPVVVMEWGQGQNLDRAIENDLNDDGQFQSASTIAGNLYLMIKTLQEWKMGHGDLQEGNLIVGTNDSITLIDYDGMFVPALDGREANEIGLADFQHPARGNSAFGSTIDDFSLLSIIFQLAIIDADSWGKYHGDKRLLLTAADYQNPKKSSILKKHMKSGTEHAAALARYLIDACSLPPLEIHAIEKIEKDESIKKWMTGTETTEPIHNYTSIIQKVVTLSDQEVAEYESEKIEIVTDRQSAQRQADAAAPSKIRDDKRQGTWESIINFLYEEEKDMGEEDQPQAADPSKPNLIGKVKKGLMDIMFEEEQEAEKKTEKKTEEETPPAPIPVPSVEPIQAETAEPEAKSTGQAEEKKFDAKTAPVPDWIKKRKGK